MLSTKGQPRWSGKSLSSKKPESPSARARESVASQHVAREARDLQRLAAGVALHDRGDLGRVGAFVLHAPEAQHALQPQTYFRLHVGEFFLDELVRGERPAELLAV